MCCQSLYCSAVSTFLSVLKVTRDQQWEIHPDAGGVAGNGLGFCSFPSFILFLSDLQKYAGPFAPHRVATQFLRVGGFCRPQHHAASKRMALTLSGYMFTI